MVPRKTAEPTGEFNPEDYLTKVSGSNYLEVKWRLVWLRKRHPNASIRTELISHEDKTAIFRAIVEIPEGGVAYGWGSETFGDFRDYLEKAETKAIGRALAALGFGTQFSGFDFSLGETVEAPQATTPSPQAAEENAGDVEVLGSRANLLSRCTQERERLGPEAVLNWMKEHTKDDEGNPKRKASEMTNEDLQRFLAWANQQPSRAA